MASGIGFVLWKGYLNNHIGIQDLYRLGKKAREDVDSVNEAAKVASKAVGAIQTSIELGSETTRLTNESIGLLSSRITNIEAMVTGIVTKLGRDYVSNGDIAKLNKIVNCHTEKIAALIQSHLLDEARIIALEVTKKD